MSADQLEPLERLSFREPGANRAKRTRARCHAELARQQRRAAPRDASTRAWEPVVVAALCSAYLVEVVRLAFHFYGVL